MIFNKMLHLCSSLLLVLSVNYVVYASENNSKTTEGENTWGPETDGYRLSIRTNKSRYMIGERIILYVSLKNMSKQDVEIMQTEPIQTYKNGIEIIIPAKKTAPLTLYGKDRVTWGGSVIGYTLKSGEQVTDSLYLNRLFDMTFTGEYKISVSRVVSKRNNNKESSVIKSNSITINISEENEEKQKSEK